MLIFFTYPLDNGTIKTYPFRIGDIIRVTNLDYRYTSYGDAFKHFTGSRWKIPYYCDHWYAELDKEFKIFEMVKHGNSNDIIIYAKDRINNDIVIDAHGVKLVRQYPLRKGESIEIRLRALPGLYTNL